MRCHIVVIIPAYNAGNHIAECLDSIIQQDYDDWEVICVDDGSTDNTQEILSDYSIKDSRIKVFYKENGGTSSARNFALMQVLPSPTTWISFVDADDYISPTMYSDIVSALKKNNSQQCDYVRLFCQQTTERPANLLTVVEDECSEPKLLTREEYFKSGEVGGYVCSAFVKSNVISENKINFPEEMKLLEDQVFSIKCAMCSKSVLIYRKRNYFYYSNPGSITRQQKDYSGDIVSCINYIYEDLSNCNSAYIYEYLCERFLPQKLEMLVAMCFKSFNTMALRKLNGEIDFFKYFKIFNFKTKLKYIILRMKGCI